MSLSIGGTPVSPVSHTVVVGWEGTEGEEKAAKLFCELFEKYYSRQFYVVKDLLWGRNLNFHGDGSETQVRTPILIGNSAIVCKYFESLAISKPIELSDNENNVCYNTIGPFGLWIQAKSSEDYEKAVEYFFNSILERGAVNEIIELRQQVKL